MDFDEALAYMQGLHRFGIKLGNARFRALLARVGDPHREYGVAHVAGTKGKGSTTAMIAAILQAHGFLVGSYYSPYVYDVRERVQVSGTMIPRQDFARLVTALAPHVEALAATDLGQTTEFELKTAIGFRYFAERAVDYAAVEVGIGGRLDATNVVAPLVSVITNIGLDHTHILGDTHAKIAFEKAGIIKPGVPAITAADHPDALQVIRSVARERTAPLLRVVSGATEDGNEPVMICWVEDDGQFTIRTPVREYNGLRLRMAGTYQRTNAACAVGAVEVMAEQDGFAVREEAVRAGLENAYLPGRLEVIHRRPTVVLDGAHNELAAQAVAGELARFPRRRLLLVVGMVGGHAPESVVDVLAPMADAVYATRPTWTRGIPSEAVAAAARSHCEHVIRVEPPLRAARAALADADEDDLVLVTGSFYTVGDVPPHLLIPPRILSAADHGSLPIPDLAAED